MARRDIHASDESAEMRTPRYRAVADASLLHPWPHLERDEVFRVPTFQVAEALIRQGADSVRIAIDEQARSDPERTWQFSPTGRLVPCRPFAYPRKTVIVLPTYNERDNVPGMVTAILTYLDTDVLIVDDGSPDGTGDVADALAARCAHVHVLHRTCKDGLGRAYKAGFHWALDRAYERIIEMDCDFSHPPWDLPRLVMMSEHADLVIGSRYVPGGSVVGWSAARRLLSRLANRYVAMFLGRHVQDWTAGFRCYRRDLLEHLMDSDVAAKGYVFQVEMAWRAKAHKAVIIEMPIHFTERSTGNSKLGWPSVFEAVAAIPLLRYGRRSTEAREMPSPELRA